MKRFLVTAFLILLTAGIAGVIGWAALRASKAVTTTTGTEVPTTRVKRGRVTITVSARGELQGGNSEMLVAPMAGVDTMAITSLRDPGELVQAGDVVVEFDTTQQEFNLREAQADLLEAEQQVIQAKANSEAIQEETKYQSESAKSDVKLAQLEVRRNPLLPTIVARQNDLAVEAAQNRLHQAEQDLVNKKANAEAGIAIQDAAHNKAKVSAETAQRMIDSMTVRAKSTGYCNLQPNTTGNIFWGAPLPALQIGDTVRAGMAIVQIPDMKNWEVSANVGELDQGHLAPGQKVSVAIVALAGKSYTGHVKAIGGTTGPSWDRHFEARIALDETGPDLRPGMSSNIVITSEVLNDVIWLPSQALFESDGRPYVYLQSDGRFAPHDVKLVRRSESQAVLTGLNEGDVVAMSNPAQQSNPAAKQQSAMKALQQ
ncbi:MAG TPA: efflux RND transporter periplasmic adaptor subunit [Bryobacteraceae bacterium]|jgi:biotin carboxyl carrier protein|nr:efflux RND transporter periplasmic adaptor subunit [Bryobacteraceae bacterium]